jgi:hypothetical protein
VVPVVLENHTKDIGYFEPFRRFARHVEQSDDLEVITSRELADALAAGTFPIRSAVAVA